MAMMIRTLIRMLQSEMTSFARRVDTVETRMTRLEQRHDRQLSDLHGAIHELITAQRAGTGKIVTPKITSATAAATAGNGDGDGNVTSDADHA